MDTRDIHLPQMDGNIPTQRQLRPAHSHQLINRVGNTIGGAGGETGLCSDHEEVGGGTGSGRGLMQRFFSIGDHLHAAGRRDGISVSTGYLNFKDVFYQGSISGKLSLFTYLKKAKDRESSL